MYPVSAQAVDDCFEDVDDDVGDNDDDWWLYDVSQALVPPLFVQSVNIWHSGGSANYIVLWSWLGNDFRRQTKVQQQQQQADNWIMLHAGHLDIDKQQ